MRPAAAARTVAVAIQGKLITKKPTTWYRTDPAKAAVAALRKQGIDERQEVEAGRGQDHGRREVGRRISRRWPERTDSARRRRGL